MSNKISPEKEMKKTTENSHLLKGNRLEGPEEGSHHQECSSPDSDKTVVRGKAGRKLSRLLSVDLLITGVTSSIPQASSSVHG